MSYLVLARKWRPQTFEEVIGQGHVTKTLQNAIIAGRVGHSYLFTGPRGVGKTSTARILAKALNCAKGPTPHPCGECASCREVAGPGSVDVIEIDGASNNSVEDIRNLREKVLYGGVRDRHKVYIIDEVHMLSGSAFNALLKTLEEPPSHVIFIFATTEVQKIPATILSRTQRFDFKRIATRELVGQLKKILDAENIPSTQDALFLVARAGGGSLRDCQTLLDQVISYCGLGADGKPKLVAAEDVIEVLGGVEESQTLSALQAALDGNLQGALTWVKNLYERGADLRQAVASLIGILRGLLLIKSSKEGADQAELLPETVAALQQLSHHTGLSKIFQMLKSAFETEAQLRFASHPRLVLESFFIRLSPQAPGTTLGELFDQLSLMEERLKKTPEPLLSASAPAPSSARAAAPEANEPNPTPAKAVPVSAKPELKVLEPVAAATAPAPKDEEKPLPPAKEEAGMPVNVLEEIEPAESKLDLEAIKAKWEQVVEKASAVSIMLGFSIRDGEISGLQEPHLLLTVRNATQRENLESAELKPKVEEILKEVYGQPLQLKVQFAAPKPASKAKAAAGKSGPTPEQIEEARKIPQVRMLEELFDAEIVDIKKI